MNHTTKSCRKQKTDMSTPNLARLAYVLEDSQAPAMFTHMSIDARTVQPNWRDNFTLLTRPKKHSNDLLRAVYGAKWAEDGDKEWLEHCLLTLLTEEKHSGVRTLFAQPNSEKIVYSELDTNMQENVVAIVDELTNKSSDIRSRLVWDLKKSEKPRAPKREREAPPSCCICQDNFPSVLLRPCKHLAICKECIELTQVVGTLMGQNGQCPVCRTKVESFEQVYV